MGYTRRNHVLLLGGYAPAIEVSKAIGHSVSYVHRLAQSGTVKSTKDGTLLYVELKSLEEHYKASAPMVAAVRKLRDKMRAEGHERAGT